MNRVNYIPVYVEKSLEIGGVWQNPPCVLDCAKKGTPCPVNKGECRYATFVNGTKGGYWAVCNAGKQNLSAIKLYKDYLADNDILADYIIR